MNQSTSVDFNKADKFEGSPWANLGLSIAEIDKELGFTDNQKEALCQPISPLTQTYKADSVQTALKATVNQIVAKARGAAEKNGILFFMDLNLESVMIDCNILKRIGEKLVEELTELRSVESIFIGNHTQRERYSISFCAFLTENSKEKPRHISKALKKQAERFGISLTESIKPGDKVIYRIGLSLS